MKYVVALLALIAFSLTSVVGFDCARVREGRSWNSLPAPQCIIDPMSPNVFSGKLGEITSLGKRGSAVGGDHLRVQFAVPHFLLLLALMASLAYVGSRVLRSRSVYFSVLLALFAAIAAMQAVLWWMTLRSGASPVPMREELGLGALLIIVLMTSAAALAWVRWLVKGSCQQPIGAGKSS